MRVKGKRVCQIKADLSCASPVSGNRLTVEGLPPSWIRSLVGCSHAHQVGHRPLQLRGEIPSGFYFCPIYPTLRQLMHYRVPWYLEGGPVSVAESVNRLGTTCRPLICTRGQHPKIVNSHSMQAEIPCPCGSGRSMAHCCGPFIAGAKRPATAEALMRSRYTAYTLGNTDYLRETWHPGTRPREMDPGEPLAWLGLKILRVEDGGEADEQGLVEFVARYKIAGRGHRLHEVSRFSRQDGRWMYLDGEKGPTAR